MKVQFERRNTLSRWQNAAMLGVAAIFILLLLAVVFAAVGADPWAALYSLVTTAFQSLYYFSEALVRASPIIFTGLAVTICLKMRLWNIGAEGQLYMGAFGAVFAAQAFSFLPKAVLIPVMMLCAMLCGGALGALVGYLKCKLNVNEILTSLLLNYVAESWLNYLIYGPWRDPANPGFPITRMFEKSAWLPTLFDSRLHLGFIMALAAAAILWFVLDKTVFGFEIRATGESTNGARYAGIPINRNIVLVFIISGALAALAGFGEVAGIHHKLQPGNVSNNYGSLGVIIAWLSNANPVMVILAAAIGGILLIGAEDLQISMGIPSDVVQITIGLLLVVILLCKFFKGHKITLVRSRGKEK